MDDILINVLPDITDIKEVCLDIEMYDQDVEKLHIPHGNFAGIAVVTEKEKIWITDPALLNPLFDKIQDVDIWILQNATYDLIQLSRFLYIKPHYIADTMLLEKSIWSGYFDEFNLKAMVRRYYCFVLVKDKYEDIRIGSIDNAALAKYAVDDALWTYRVYKKQMAVIDEKSYNVYKTIDAPMIWVVLSMKRPMIDKVAWMENAMRMEQEAKRLESELGVNVQSSKQVCNLLSQLFGKPFNSSANDVLEQYKDNETVQKIIDARTYRKAQGTYGRKWLEDNLLEDDTVASSWQIIGAETGRMSSRKPNLQQIPQRKLPQYRDFFVSKNGKLIVADVSQQEPRILAYISQDKSLKKFFVAGDDIHLTVTRQIFKDETIEHDNPLRKVGKAINLGTSYGLTPEGLAEAISIPVEEAEKFIKQYFEAFPDVHRYIQNTRDFAFRNEYVCTPFGRKIWINIHNPQWKNNAINSPIQGGGADMVKLWMVKLMELCWEHNLSFPVVLVVHDELVLDVPEDETDMWIEMLRKAFNSAVDILFPDLDFPFEFEYEIGDKWSIKK